MGRTLRLRGHARILDPYGIQRNMRWPRKISSGSRSSHGNGRPAVQRGANIPYANTIPVRLEPLFPGDQDTGAPHHKRIDCWNGGHGGARKRRDNIGGHFQYASEATLTKWGLNSFLQRAQSEEFEGDTVYCQGHASPGMSARRVFGRPAQARKSGKFFAAELKPGGGRSSYPQSGCSLISGNFRRFPWVSAR